MGWPYIYLKKRVGLKRFNYADLRVDLVKLKTELDGQQLAWKLNEIQISIQIGLFMWQINLERDFEYQTQLGWFVYKNATCTTIVLIVQLILTVQMCLNGPNFKKKNLDHLLQL